MRIQTTLLLPLHLLMETKWVQLQTTVDRTTPSHDTGGALWSGHDQ